MARYLYIAGVDRWNDLIRDTLQIEQVLTSTIDACSFQVRGERPTQGEEVRIVDDSLGCLFGGIIDRVELAQDIWGLEQVWKVEAQDYTYMLNRRKVVETYENTAADVIVKDIITKYGGGDFATNHVSTGAPTIELLVFDYVSPFDALKEVADYCGWDFYIDYDKDVWFFNPAEVASPAPMVLEPGGYFRNLKHSINQEGLRNRVYVRGGTMLSDPWTYEVKADDSARAWVLPHKPHNITVKVGGVTKTCGIENVHEESQYDFLMNFQEKYVRCSAQTPTPTADTTLSFTYRYDIDVITMVEDIASQQAIAAVQGGDGVYEHVIVDDSLTTIDAAEAAGMADLREHANPRVKGSFETEYKLTISPDYVSRILLNSAAIVTNPEDPIYASAGFSPPPAGAVFLGVNQSTVPALPSGYLDTISACWALIDLVKLYQQTNNTTALQRATMIGDYLLGLTIDADFYGSPFKLIPNRMEYAGGAWVSSLATIHVRTQYHAIWALLELHRVGGQTKYRDAATDLLKTAGLVYNNIKSRSGTEISAWMYGAVYNTFENTSGNSYALSWNVFATTTGDIMARAINVYVELVGNNPLPDPQETVFTPQAILDDFRSWLVDCYYNHGLVMGTVRLAYGFYHYDWSDPLEGELYVPRPKNWDWINNVWGDVWWTSDAQAWCIIGFALIGETAIAGTLRNALVQLKVTGKGEEILFYDRYNFDGSPLTEDRSISICVTGLLFTLDKILSDYSISNQLLQTLNKYSIQSNDSTSDGGYPWDVAEPGQNLEFKTIGEILLNSAELAVFASKSWAPGQLVTINLPDRGIQGTFLVQKVTITPCTPDKWTYRVEYGGRLLGIADWLQALWKAQQKKKINETAVLHKFHYGTEGCGLTDDIISTSRVPPWKAGDSDAICGFVVCAS